MILHERAAALAIGAAVALSIADGLKAGHVVWPAVGAAALTAWAGVAGSALGAKKL